MVVILIYNYHMVINKNAMLASMYTLVCAACVVYKLQAIFPAAALLRASVIDRTLYASLIVLGEMRLANLI